MSRPVLPSQSDEARRLTASPPAARSTAAMAIRFIASIACMARCALAASGSVTCLGLGIRVHSPQILAFIMDRPQQPILTGAT
jgi:hypothetical protein